MFNTTISSETNPNETDLTHQADDVTSRLSEGDNTSAQDQLNQTQETLSSTDSYAELTLPEALQGNDENFASFKKLAATLQLPTETVRKLVEWEASATTDMAKRTAQERADILQKWTDQTKEMLGPEYQRELTRALQAADRFGGPELRELLEVTGLGSHPVVVKTFHQISQQISEDASVGGKLRNTTDKTFAEALYGKAY